MLPKWSQESTYFILLSIYFNFLLCDSTYIKYPEKTEGRLLGCQGLGGRHMGVNG